VINTETLAENPNLGKALVGAWYETMALMSAQTPEGAAVRTFLGEASGTDLAGYDAQLASTQMFYTPAEALALTESQVVYDTMKKVAEFSFDHGLLGEGAPDAGFIGIETPAGTYGSAANMKLRFDPTYMKMAADGEL